MGRAGEFGAVWKVESEDLANASVFQYRFMGGAIRGGERQWVG